MPPGGRLRHDTVFFRQSHYAVVTLAHAANFAAKGISLVGAGHPTGFLVQLGDVYLEEDVQGENAMRQAEERRKGGKEEGRKE